MQTLLEALAEIHRLETREALRFSNGFRTWKLTYGDLYRDIAAFSAYLDRAGLQKGDRVIVWAENRPEWVTAFWACVARGIQVVPVDFRSSIDLVRRIQGEVRARLIVTGDAVQPEAIGIPEFPVAEFAALPANENFQPAEISPDDVVEIVYTSGTTGEPMGVVHRHHNICANLTPIQAEMRKYEKWARPFQPVRILDMLPLSHLFGQSLGIFTPPLLGGAAVFMTDLQAGAIIDTIRRERISVLVSVPKLLINLQHEIERRFNPSSAAAKLKGIPGILERWWRYRKIHAALGYKFWALVVGGAEVNPDVEAFWARLGLLVVQGYGLTETSPVVALNHPFNARTGSIGKPLPGQEVNIAPDGEILVRGDSVINEYLGPGGRVENRVENGWLHTGDIGEMDAEGRLYYKGRKKEMIVTSEGLNVYPQDVERVLNGMAQVKDSAVVAARRNGEELVHAALILRDSSADPAAIIAQANRTLEAHQRVQSWSLWPEEDFPRTPSTMKVKRGEIARRIADGGPPPAPDRNPAGILARLKDGGDRRELGLSSLERVELLSELESQYGVELDERRFAEVSTVDELDALVRGAGETATREPPALLPRWARSFPARALRFLLFQALFSPLMRGLLTLEVEGLENLDGVEPPVLFASNHQSHLDTPAIFVALPRRWRYLLAPAMSQDYFRAWLEPGHASFPKRVSNMLEYFLAAGLFNAYPLPQHMVGVRRALKYTGELIDEGYCPLVFPEGRCTPDGALHPFRNGIGLMASRLRVPVVPIRVDGLFEIYSIHDRWPRRGTAKVRIGPPLRLERETSEEGATRSIEKAVADMAASHFTS